MLCVLCDVVVVEEEVAGCRLLLILLTADNQLILVVRHCLHSGHGSHETSRNACTQPPCQCLPYQTSEMGDIRPGVRLGFYGTTDPTAQQLAEEADQTMFREVRYRDHLLPDIISHRNSLRPRPHNYVLTTKTGERNFIVRQLFSNIY